MLENRFFLNKFLVFFVAFFAARFTGATISQTQMPEKSLAPHRESEKRAKLSGNKVLLSTKNLLNLLLYEFREQKTLLFNY